MSENAIPISNLNDFVFCPASICFHGLDAETLKLLCSVYEIDNGERLLNNIETEIRNTWMPQFGQQDSVYVFHLSSSCRVEKYGYARNEDEDLLIIS